jgi:hypothetical protein
MTGALPDQALALSMGAACILLLDAGHSDDGADMALASVDRDQRA